MANVLTPKLKTRLASDGLDYPYTHEDLIFGDSQSVPRIARDLLLENGMLFLIKNGTKIGKGITLPTYVIPTKVSQLTNDSGFLTSIPQEYVTDTELVQKGYATTRYVDDSKPTKVSQLINDSGFISSIPPEYVTDTELSTKNYATKQYVDDSIPTNISELTDDIGIGAPTEYGDISAMWPVGLPPLPSGLFKWILVKLYNGEYRIYGISETPYEDVFYLRYSSTDHTNSQLYYLNYSWDVLQYKLVNGSWSKPSVYYGVTISNDVFEYILGDTPVIDKRNGEPYPIYGPKVPGEIINVSQLVGSTTSISSYAGKEGQIIVDKEKKELHLMDGITPGGKTIGENIDWNKILNKPSVFNPSSHSHSYDDLTNKPTIPIVTNDLTDTLKTNYDNAYTHSQETHAPVDAQKNSDITKAEIEEKLVGVISSHSHDASKDTLVTTNINTGILTLTTDKYQTATMIDGTEIVLPTVTELTEIHLFFNVSSDMTLILPNCKWQSQQTITANKTYEVIFTYITEWLGGWIIYE